MKYYLIFILFQLLKPNLVSAENASKGKIKKHSTESELSYVNGRMLSTDKNIKIPSSLVKIIEDYYLARFKEKDPVRAKLSSRAELLNKLIRKFLNFDVYFTDPSKKALNHNYHFPFTRGGGVIDLAEYISSEKGQFNMKIKLNAEDFIPAGEDRGKLNVYFLSHFKKMDILGQRVGAGCFTYFNISNFFMKKLSTEGIVLNSSYQRYLAIIGGTFFFYYSELDSLYLGSLTFKDSRFPKWSCPGFDL
jgi:hypothetical protein